MVLQWIAYYIPDEVIDIIVYPWASYQIRKSVGRACAWSAGNVFPATARWWSRHASRHVREARAVRHAGIAN